MIVLRAPGFHPEHFVGLGWTVESNSYGSTFEPAGYVKVVNTLTPTEKLSEIGVTPKTRLARLAERKLVPVGGKGIERLLARPRLLPRELKERALTGRPVSALCLGNVLRSPSGTLYVLYLYWWETRSEKGLRWHYLPFDSKPEYVPYVELVYTHP
jgi:hypothetical protein